ncbi:hypothetical protein QBC47DRAFT_134877 [Echria macrotheca]|uniref:Uncharacterized protein n=1 Tax=Echria macrotheca TaxID=438768 RepID=A0AAJ0BHB3_9PEZI|nr:hypothetical protein QBC47DRAFT_134877 [Echria macrotheca]
MIGMIEEVDDAPISVPRMLLTRMAYISTRQPISMPSRFRAASDIRRPQPCEPVSTPRPAHRAQARPVRPVVGSVGAKVPRFCPAIRNGSGFCFSGFAQPEGDNTRGSGPASREFGRKKDDDPIIHTISVHRQQSSDYIITVKACFLLQEGTSFLYTAARGHDRTYRRAHMGDNSRPGHARMTADIASETGRGPRNARHCQKMGSCNSSS